MHTLYYIILYIQPVSKIGSQNLRPGVQLWKKLNIPFF